MSYNFAYKYFKNAMQQEDDLKGLAKVMEFVRAINTSFCSAKIFWFCYFILRELVITIGEVDKILLNFDHTAGLSDLLVFTE